MSDVYTINEVLRHLNAEVVFENNQVTIDSSKELNIEAPFEYVRKMRASVQVMGPLLARNGRRSYCTSWWMCNWFTSN